MCALTGVLSRQAPREEKQNAVRRSGSLQQDVPLDKLPVPTNGMIVVTPDLKRALDALGAGSVVLSAERYKELMSRLDSTKSGMQPQEILFSRCSIVGEVSIKSGRELADLTFDLEFRTDSPDTIVALPFKGLRLSAASINGVPPLWGPDPENMSILIREAKVYQLKISTSIPISRVGQQKRLILERVPASAITSLQLKLQGAASQPEVAGYGSIQVAATTDGNSLLQAPALGVLSKLELTWQPNTITSATQASVIEGDFRIHIEETNGVVEARLKPVPFAPIQLPWKIRLPGNAQNVRAELLRNEGMNSEPLLATAQRDGTFLVTSAYPLVTAGFREMLVRWRQALPDDESSEVVFLGSCQVIEPIGQQQTGTLLFNMPDDPVALFKPRQLISQERNSAERASRRQQRYRYEQQPAGFEVMPVARRLVRGLVDAKIRHVVTAQPQSWLLSTEIEIAGNTRSQLSRMELSWPSGWKLNRRILLTPLIRDLEHDEKNNRVRLSIDSKPTSPLIIKLEGQSTSLADHLIVTLPQVLSAECLVHERLQSAELLIQKEQLKLESMNSELRISQVDPALQAEKVEGILSQNQFRLLRHPASLTLTRTLLLPQYSSRADVYIGEKECITRQTFQFSNQVDFPRQIQALIPRIARSTRWFQQFSDGRKREPVTFKFTTIDDDAMQLALLDLPTYSVKDVKLVCEMESSADHPITVPLVRFHPGQASLQNVVSVKTVCDTGIAVSLPPDLTGWLLQSDGDYNVYQGDSLTPLLVLEKKTVPVVDKPVPLERLTTTAMQQSGSWLLETTFELGPVNQTHLTTIMPLSFSKWHLLGWKYNNETMPLNQITLDEMENNSGIRIHLPVSALGKQIRISLTYEVERSQSYFWWRLPVLHFPGDSRQNLVPHDWFIQGNSKSWLWASNAVVANWFQTTEAWKPVGSQSLANHEQISGYHLSHSGSEHSLWLVTLPRMYSLILMSLSVLVLFQFMLRHYDWKQRFVLFLAFLCCCIYAIVPNLALAIFWSSVPGVVACLLLNGWNNWVKSRSHGPRVFQSTAQRTIISTRQSLSAMLPKSGYDAPTVLASKPPVAS